MKVWDQFLQLLEAELGVDTVAKWLKTLKVLQFDACNLYLEAKDSFQVLWFEEHVRSKILSRFFNGNNKRIKVHLTIGTAAPPQKKNKYRAADPKKSLGIFELSFDELNPHCRFDNFVISEENKMLVQFLHEVAGISQTPQSLGATNPIYLYGHSGSGKTHLLMSLAHALREQGLRVIYVRAETFTDHVVSAIRAGEMSHFRQIYRNAEVLIIDDVHVFSRKAATQEEFFHTFNTLHIENKQIVLSANCTPQELQFIEPRLISRFEWGISLPVKTIKHTEFKQLLLKKAETMQFPLPSKIIEFFLDTFKSGPKTMIKALEALVLRLHLDNKHTLSSLSPIAVKTLINDVIGEEQKSIITPTKIIQAVADHYGIRTEDILGKAQTKECTLPRQLAMHLCRDKLKMPYMKIGDLFSRDHSTVMSSVKQVQKALKDSDSDLMSANQDVQKKLYSA